MEIVKWEFWKSSLKGEQIVRTLFSVLHPLFFLLPRVWSGGWELQQLFKAMRQSWEQKLPLFWQEEGKKRKAVSFPVDSGGIISALE